MEKLFCDLRTDEEKADFFLSGQGYSTGVIAKAVQNDVAMAYRRCAEYKKACHDAQAIRNAALEEAARQCGDIYSWRGAYSAGLMSTNTLDACAAAIRALKSQVASQTCGGNGMIGGPSYYEPCEGGEPCPDCSQVDKSSNLQGNQVDKSPEMQCQPSAQDREDAERYFAIREGARNAACTTYFAARGHLNYNLKAAVFEAGFDRGWDASRVAKENGND